MEEIADGGIFDDFQKLVALGINQTPQLVEHRSLWPPDATANHQFAGLEMHIVARNFSVPATFSNHGRKIVFVGTFVFSEANVAVDAIHAALDVEPPTPLIILTHEHDEAFDIGFPRLANHIVFSFVLLKPSAVVVHFQAAKKRRHIAYFAMRFH